MEDTNKYISGLLFIHDCVILPGFGGFVCNYKSAQHNTDNHTFDPPSKDVLFNRHLTYNDGLLINYLAKNQGISYAEAEEIIRVEVQQAWLRLDKGELVHFQGVGTFHYDKNQQLCFSPDDSENYLTDSYGLSSFRFPPLSYQKSTVEFVPKYKSSTSMNPGVKQTLRWAAVVLPLAGILALLPYFNKHKTEIAGLTIFKRQQTEELQNTIPEPEEAVEELAIPASADSASAEEIEITTDKRSALLYTPSEITTEKKQVTTGLTYYIIGGSYKNEVNAQIDCGEFKDAGFAAAEVIADDDLYRVSMVKFDDKVAALHELRRLRGLEQHQNVWLFAR